jgi:8-oxo-dGTP pyrophosphatase MutT (NUDIX family)
MKLPDSADFSPQSVATRARARLYSAARHAPEDSAHSDAAIAGLNPDAQTLASARPAAVLIPIVARSEGATLLLTRRAASLREHSGQIAFPGGRIDAGDDGPKGAVLGAALREAREEIGLEAHHIEPLGYLGPYFSSTGYRISPVVGLVAPGSPLTLNAAEVEGTFEAPLSFLMNPANHQLQAREWKGETRHFFAMPYGEHYIWGVTAGILRMLWLRLYAPHDS